MNKRKKILLAVVNGALVLLALVCLLSVLHLRRLLPSQEAAERWRGGSELNYSQISAFVPVDEKLSLNQIYEFRRAMMTRLHEAALDIDNDEQLFTDAWCVTGKAIATTDLGKGDASVIAVGGNFFGFHPIQLINGSYFQPQDLMKDRVLLDEELAWLLYGGTNLQGMEVKIDGVPFVISGVIRREQDFASKKAYTAGMGLYMSYDAWAAMKEGTGITTYELVMAEPVKNFTINLAREKFPIGQGELLQNSGRFEFGRLLGLVRQFGSRSMQKLGVLYPYWENAARCIEDWCSLLLFLCLLLSVLPIACGLVLLQRMLRRGKEKLEDELLPEWKDRAEEAVRVQQRRRWEKKHGEHEK